jgi:phospholipid/cholesterol/gamma-HCH transport system permease protein
MPAHSLNFVSYLGRSVFESIEGFGRFTRFGGSVALWSVRGGGAWGALRLLMPQLYQIGTLSIPVVMIVGAFVGMVLGVEAYDQFAAIGQAERLGGVINISVVKQVGPVLAAVMIAGRVGGAVSAELGTMRVTEQIDALRVMGSDPVAYLVVPRVIACLLMVPLLTVFSNLMGILGGYLVTVHGFGVNAAAYWEFSARFIGNWEIAVGLIKSVAFGLAIGLISAYKGFYCEPGAAGVGKAATNAFVTSFIAIIVSNLFLAKLLKDMYLVFFGHASLTAFSG